ncbi:hypothetical protein Aperf_G00000089130 [Anoplocephala perfoliata]
MTQKLLNRGCCKLLGRSIKKEFSWKNIGLELPDPYQLSLPQWKWMDGGFYISFRFVVATLLITWLACEIPFELRHLGEKPVFPWITYATEWAFIIYTFTTIGFAIFCIYYTLNKDRSNDLVGNKVLWFFFNLSCNTILTTSGVYWIGFWDRDYAYFFKLSSKLKHSVPAILVIVDMFISNMPIRLMHSVYPTILGIFYSLFTFVYWLSGSSGYVGNGIIYPVLNWNKPGYAVGACVLVLLFCLIIQALLYLMYFTRTYLSYLVGGRGASTLRSLCPESADESQLIAGSPDIEGDSMTVPLPKTYSSIE